MHRFDRVKDGLPGLTRAGLFKRLSEVALRVFIEEEIQAAELAQAEAAAKVVRLQEARRAALKRRQEVPAPGAPGTGDGGGATGVGEVPKTSVGPADSEEAEPAAKQARVVANAMAVDAANSALGAVAVTTPVG